MSLIYKDSKIKAQILKENGSVTPKINNDTKITKQNLDTELLNLFNNNVINNNPFNNNVTNNTNSNNVTNNNNSNTLTPEIISQIQGIINQSQFNPANSTNLLANIFSASGGGGGGDGSIEFCGKWTGTGTVPGPRSYSRGLATWDATWLKVNLPQSEIPFSQYSFALPNFVQIEQSIQSADIILVNFKNLSGRRMTYKMPNATADDYNSVSTDPSNSYDEGVIARQNLWYRTRSGYIEPERINYKGTDDSDHTFFPSPYDPVYYSTPNERWTDNWNVSSFNVYIPIPLDIDALNKQTFKIGSDSLLRFQGDNADSVDEIKDAVFGFWMKRQNEISGDDSYADMYSNYHSSPNDKFRYNVVDISNTDSPNPCIFLENYSPYMMDGSFAIMFI